MKKTYLTSIITIFFLTFISVAYAAFSSELNITGEASVLKDTTAPTCGSWYLRDSSLTTQQAYDQNKFINAGSNSTWTNTNKTLFIECTDNMDGEYGCINVDAVSTSGGTRYFKDVKDYTASIKTDNNTVTVTLKDAYQNERTCTLPVGGSNPYIDKQGPSITISRTAANKFTYSATDDMSSIVTTQYMVTNSSTQPGINDSGWSSTASEVTIDQTAAKTYYVWAKDGVNITHQTISTYKLTKTQGTGTTLTLKYNNNSGAELNTSYVLAGTPVYVTASANNGYGSLVLKKDSTSISSGSTQTISGATTISSSATANIYSVTLNNQGATTGGTTKYYYQYNTTKVINNVTCYYYTDSALTECLNQGYYITKPEKTGYTFGGYYTSTNGGGTQYIDANGGGVNNIYQKTPNQIDSSYTTNINLYAKWTAKTYTLTLNKNDGTSAGTTSLTATYNSSALTPTTITLPTKSFTISGFGTAAARNSDGATVSSTSSLTSTATFNGYYTVSTGGSLIVAANTTSTFNTASVSGYLSSGTWVRDANTNLYAQFGAMPSKTLPTITKTGYTCGWTTSSTGTSIQYQSGGNLIPTSNTTLYGVCVPNELTFDNQTVSSTFATSQQTITNGITAATNGTGTYTYAITGGNSNSYFSLNGRDIKVAANTPANTTGYQVTITATDSNSGATKSATYTIKVNKAACTLTTTAKSMTTGDQLTLSTAANNAKGSLSYAFKSGGRQTTTASTISSGVMTAGAMSTANDTAQPVDVQITDAGNGNYNGCTKDVVITVNKKSNTIAANSKTVYVSSSTALSTLIKNNNGGTVSYAIGTDNTQGSSISGSNFVAGVLAANDDSNKTVTLTATSARTATVAQGSANIIVTVQKYTNALSWTGSTPANNAELAYGTSYTATATPETNGGTNGAITYSSATTSAMTINSTSGAITVAKADGSSSVITASMAGTSTVKAASITRTFKTKKGTCPAPTNVAISTTGAVTWTQPSAASSSQISIDDSTYTAATSGVDYNSTITASTGTRTVYVRSVCNTTYYSQYSSSTSKATTVYSVTLAKGTGISAVSNNGTSTTNAVNYITGRSITVNATVQTGYTWSKWTNTSGGSQVTTTQNYTFTLDGNKAWTATTTANTYTIAYAMNNGNNPDPKPTSGTYNSDVTIGTTSAPTKSVTITGNANSTGASVGAATVNSQTFTGWSSSSGAGLGSGAKTGTSATPSTAWNGSATTNKYFRNLRDTSGTVTLTANWGGSSTLPTVTKTGYTCGWYDTNGTSGGNYIGSSGGSYTVPSGSSTAITVYARCTPNVYTITLNQQSGSGGTGTIYEKYDDGYYLTYSSGAVSNKMSTSANGVTVPTRTGYTFGGYYTSTGGAGTQYIDANGKLTSSASASQFSSSTNTLYAKWTINQYTVTCKDYFVDASDNLKVLLGSSTKSLDYGSSVSGATWGTTTTTSTYYGSYSYHGSSAATTVPANNDLVVYRYFYAWTDLNIYYASGSSQSGATVEFKVGSGSWVDVTNESNTIQPWGTTYYVRNIRPKNATEEFSHVNANLVWDSTNQYYSYTPTAAGTSMNIYMKYKIYTITLDKQSGSGGTGTIYEKYNTGYYTDSAATTQMTTSANPVSVPSRTGYTFGGYYTSTGGAGTQYIDANGKLTSSASSTQFSANGSLYAKWTANSYTVVYNKSNSNETGTLPASQSATYDTAFTLGSNSMSRPNSGNSNSYTLTFLKGTASSAAPSAITNTKYYSYTANGWATSANGSQAYTSGQTNVKNLTATAGGTYNLYTSWSATTHQNAITLPAAATKNNTNLGTVTFKYQDGATADTTSTAYNTYAFSGWYDAETGGNKLGNASASYTPNASKNVYPQFTATAHSASFPAPTRNGYTFAGWFTAETGGTQVTTYTGSSNVTYYAHWTGNTYYVYYNQGLATGGWSTSTYATQSRTFPGSTTLRTNSMTKTATTANSYTVTYNQGTATGGWDATTYGTQTSINTTSYTADGWSTGSTNLNDRDYANGASYGANSTANLTLYPNFSTSTTNGGVTTRTNSMTKSNSADSNSYTLTFKQGDASSAAPSAITNKKYTSYTANGWTTTSGSTTKTHNNNTATGALTGNITLYPCFSETVNQKSITLPAAATKNNTNLGTVTFKYQDNVTADTTSTAYNTYAFKGWYTASSGGTKLGDANASYTPSASIDVYPQFTATAHSATFPSPSRTGYTFAGWYDASSGGNKVTSYTGSSNVTYYAHWTPISYTVVYNKSNSNETGSLPANQSATYDTTFTIGTNSMSRPNSSDTDSYTLTFKQGVATSAAPAAITNKKYTSYTANGWATSANGSRAYTSGQTGVKNLTTTNNATVNLYTSWSSQVNQRSITLPTAATKSNTNLGTVTFNYNGSGAASTTSTGYTSYAFTGWYTAQTGGTKVGDAGATYTPSASIDVYPQFTATAHSATFPSPSRTGYTFAGWFTAASGGTQVTSYTGTSAVEYFAHWTPISYTVVYNKSNSNETGTLPSNQPATYDTTFTIGTNSMSRPNSSDTDSYTLTFKQGAATSSAPAAITNKKYTSYTANGWATSANGARAYTNGQTGVKNLTTTNNATVNLYTSWNSQVNQRSITLPTAATKSNTNLGTVTFNYNGSGAAATTSTGYTTYAFSGWYTDQTGGTKLGDAGATYTPDQSIDVYPQFSSTAHSATFPSSPTRTGYVFAGWYTAASGGTQVTSYTGTSAVEYYAHWTPNTYTIAYTMNNGTDPNPKPTSGTYDSNVSIGTTSIPSKTVTITGNANGTGASVGSATVNSLTFNGWSSSSGAGLQGNAQSGSTTSNFASWTGGTTTNKYFKNLRNGSGTVTLTANWSTTVTLPTLSKTGHTCSWVDSNGNPFSTTIAQNANTSITVYAQCTPNTYNITLNQQSGSGGTSTIYEKYSDGYYLNNSGGVVSNKMSTSANGVTVPTRSGYTFGGYYTSTNGGGTQYIDANGKLTSSASPTQFSAAGNLYAKWTLNTPATPTISGGATKVYGSSSTTLTCSNSTTYPSGITKKYQFGYASSDGGSPGNWTTESDSNTLTIAANAYVEQRWYSCRVRAYDGSAYSGYATSSTSADTEMTINNATLTFDANNGTGGGTVYTKTGQNVVYDGIRSTSTTSIPTTSRSGYTFLGWYDAPSGGNKVLNADGSFTGTAVSGYTSTNTWVATTNKTLYAYWNGITYTITFHYGNSQRNDIPYTSSNTYQTVIIPTTGKYRLEAWGAQGGSSVNNGGESYSAGGKGAYTSGVAPFNADDTLYVYVGQKPGYVSSGKADNPGGWNGGGTGRWDHGDNDSSGGGGGATDFRYFGSDTPNLTVGNAVSLRYRIMVAGGGSGNAWSSNPGHAGALASSLRGRVTSPTNQTTGKSFGIGGTSGVTGKTKVGNSGGGGGYWGGYAGGARSGNTDDSGQGTGGSSYISGYTGAVAVRNNTTNDARFASDGTTLCADGTTDNTCSIHFTGKVFEDPVMISGESPSADIIGTDEELEYIMEDPDGIEVYGHAGNGHARISLDSVQKQVTSGQAIGSAPLPYGNGTTYWDIYDDEGEDEEGVPFYYSYNIEYDINWAYKAIEETEDDEGNPTYMETDVPIDLNETYDPLYGTDFYAYGTPHEYSITYSDVSANQWCFGHGPGYHCLEHPSHYNSLDEITIPKPYSGMYSGTYYKFLGWTDQYSISPTTSYEINKGDSGDLELTANWETKSTFTVRYDGNGGITTCSSGSDSYNEYWYLCTDKPTYGNVQFLGWYTEPTGGDLMGDGTYALQYQYGHGNYEGDYVLYAHWDIDAIEYNYNITQSFAANRMMNTYYAPDWTKTFEVEIKFSIATASKRYLLFGNYDNSATNALNIEVAQNNTIRVYVGKGSTNATFGSVSTNQEITVKALWNGTTQKLTVDVTGGGTGHYEGTLTALANISGKTNRHFRFGASDYRASSTPFNTINVKNFVIREFYSPPLQDTITVPDPAGHYYLFEGWTGTNGETPQYNLTVPTNSEGLISYKANWSTGVSFKAYSKTFSTSNQYIKFKNEVTVVYIDQARRVAYTRERVYFYRTNTGYNTYGQGSMKVKYNWSAGSQTWTVDLAGKKINENGINLWSENWNAYSISYRTIPYLDNGTRSVTLGVTSFTHAIFSVSTPKNATFSLPAIKAKPTQ